MLKSFFTEGLNLDSTPAEGVEFPDPKDIVFYEIALSRENLLKPSNRHFSSTEARFA